MQIFLFYILPFQEGGIGAVAVVEHQGKSQSSEQVAAIVSLFFCFLVYDDAFLCDE